jgi:hypothetical protein
VRRAVPFLRAAFSGAFLLFPALAARAGGPGSTAAAFLKLPSGARAIAMGESYVAAGDDVQAIGWNPAGLAEIDGREFTFMHAEWFQGIRYESLAYAQPLGGFLFLGGGVDFLNSGTMDKTAFAQVSDLAVGPESRLFSTLPDAFVVSNVVVTAAGAVDISGLRWLPVPNVQGGMNIRALVSKIDTASQSGASLDLGFRWSPERLKNWTFAIVGQNMGPALGSGTVRKVPPITFRTGAAYRGPNRNYVVDLDVLVPVDNAPRFSVGGEYWYKQMLAFRGGYRLQTNGPDPNEYDTGGLEGISVGAGFRYAIVRVDYAFATLGFLGAAHRVSLTVNF